MDGWIKLHRKIQDHWIYQEKRKFSRYEAWLDMIMMANHKSNRFLHGNELVDVERGQFITSELKLMERWDWGKNKLRLFLDLLEKDGMIIKKTDRKRTAITICNYGLYHDSETEDGPQPDQSRTNDGPSADTNKNDKNVKNEKKEKKKDNIPKISFSESVQLTQVEYDRLVSEFGEDVTKKAIDYLTSYKAEKGYKTKSDNLTIRRWVIEAVTKQKGGRAFGKHEGHNDRPTGQSKFASADKNKPFDPSELENLGIT